MFIIGFLETILRFILSIICKSWANFVEWWPTRHRLSNKLSSSLENDDGIIKVPYTILLGPSNSGKTKYFMKMGARGKKFIISVLDKEQLLPLDYDTWLHKPTIKWINIRKNREPLNYLLLTNSQTNILLDEVHLFSPEERKCLTNLVNKMAQPPQFYISLLTGSHTGSELPGTHNILSGANLVQNFYGHCQYCNERTSSSGLTRGQCTEEIQVGKNLFAATCTRCKAMPN